MARKSAEALLPRFFCILRARERKKSEAALPCNSDISEKEKMSDFGKKFRKTPLQKRKNMLK
jgi:hypothetical protein